MDVGKSTINEWNKEPAHPKVEERVSKNPERLLNLVTVPDPVENQYVSSLVVSDPSLELSMRLASVKSIEDLGKFFVGHQYEFDVQHEAELLYNWNLWGEEASLADYILPSETPKELADPKLPQLSSIENMQGSSKTPVSSGVLPPLHHYHRVGGARWTAPRSQAEQEEYDEEFTKLHSYITACVTCKRVISEMQVR